MFAVAPASPALVARTDTAAHAERYLLLMPAGGTQWVTNAADTPKVSDLNIGRLMPMAAAAIGWSRIAINARPTRPRSRFHASTNMMIVTISVKK